ncbi:MAG: hypothetical protein KUG77_21555 [Nannocystaceae bacterium]|nr:hypothetical protein [Nannocystaceae bacterium]
MRTWIADASVWTPERGAVSAEDGLGALSRFSRTCAAVVERVLIPDRDVLVILGTSTLPTVSATDVARELGARWPGSGLEFVVAGSKTLPLSGLDALASVGCGRTVLWAVVDLKPGAELAAVVRLSRAATNTRLEIARTDELAPPAAEHLNSCAGLLSLVETVDRGSVSIKVDSWSLAVTPEL